MKKPVDLISICESYNDLTDDTFKLYKKSLGFEIRDTELEQMCSLINNFDIDDIGLNYFYVGYKIPQINKEFDLLRIGTDFILNIEIKSNATNEKILAQLNQNQYYLKALDRNLHLFTYLADENTLLKIEDGELVESNFKAVEKLILSQNVEHMDNIDSLFEPQKYLVSIFNDTDRFMESHYFLTQQQSQFKKEILSKKVNCSMIEGKPGTGKSLLLYDIAKELFRDKKILIIHCGQLNEGHLKMQLQYEWNILSAKDSSDIDRYKPDVVFIDEAQRFWPKQLEHVLEYIIRNNIKGVISIDPQQILGGDEKNFKNKERIIEFLGDKVNRYCLSDKIRSNKDLHSFVLGITHLGRLKEVRINKNISIHYFSKLESAKKFAEEMEDEGWQIIDYTGQRYNGATIEKMKLYLGQNAHEVIGQEFDKVLTVLGPAFYYNEERKLSAMNRNHYDTVKMFYQAITRSREKIMLVIVDNKELFTQIMENLYPE